ncbi:hypothetical protein M422DRAFT_250008 [Sphaerobolus stellatus SS14]|nr:hypothetical protein M422DRAFT_250008 [Sphaerobolus stellatus SS14]
MEEGEVPVSLYVWDFNPVTWRRPRRDYDADVDGPEATVHSESQPKVFNGLPRGLQIFTKPIETSLPYRETRLNKAFNYEAVMIDENCLVGLVKSSAHGIRSETVEFLCI